MVVGMSAAFRLENCTTQTKTTRQDLANTIHMDGFSQQGLCEDALGFSQHSTNTIHTKRFPGKVLYKAAVN